LTKNKTIGEKKMITKIIKFLAEKKFLAKKFLAEKNF